MRKSIIVGCRGQDGRLLEALLRRKGDRPVGIGREGPVDVRDAARVAAFVKRQRPDEIYYLASYQHSSQERPPEAAELHRRSWEVNVLGLVNVLEAMRLHSPKTRLFYASSSRVFGEPGRPRVDEKTPLAPLDAYGVSKATGMAVCRLYRRRHGLFASSGILFNHDAPGRDPKFVSGKIVRAVAAIKAGRQKNLVLGRLDDKIDWGAAADAVEAMVAILRRARGADDFVISTGRTHSVRDFVAAAFAAAGLDWRRYVGVDPALLSAPRKPFVGSHLKLTRVTGWRPRTSFEAMVRGMVITELAATR